MRPLRTAVVGVGYLGRFHAQKYAALHEAELLAVVDSDVERAASIAQALGCRALSDYRQLIGLVDAVSIVVPTQAHYAVARDLLAAGVHVLLEKPMTTTLDEADELIAVARERGCCLQVGHLERFNPAVQALLSRVGTPLFIETHRLAPFNPRGADVSVVLDLMIHDIDIILNLVRQPLTGLQASGVPVISNDIDIVNARLQFADGCVANVTASRVSMQSKRKLRLFQRCSYFSLDFQARTLEIRRTSATPGAHGLPDIESETLEFADGDAIRSEISAFLTSIRNGTPPQVSGEDGRQALATAIEISQQLNAN